jgi:hypothetical protein
MLHPIVQQILPSADWYLRGAVLVLEKQAVSGLWALNNTDA